MTARTNSMKNSKALVIYNSISENVEAFYASKITYAEFNTKAFALWDAAAAQGVTEQVRKMVDAYEKNKA